MTSILKKLNFIFGIVFVIIGIIIGKFLEDIARVILNTIHNLLFSLGLGGPGSGGYIDLFWESFITEGLGTAVYSGTAIFGPILLFEKFFKNIKINWVPSIFLLFLFFLGFFINGLIQYFKGAPNVDFIDNIQIIVMYIGYFFGAFIPLIMALKYVGFKHSLLDKFD